MSKTDAMKGLPGTGCSPRLTSTPCSPAQHTPLCPQYAHLSYSVLKFSNLLLYVYIDHLSMCFSTVLRNRKLISAYTIKSFITVYGTTIKVNVLWLRDGLGKRAITKSSLLLDLKKNQKYLHVYCKEIHVTYQLLWAGI